MDSGNNISYENYFNNLPDLYNEAKKISLYDLIKLENPEIIKNLNKKIYSKKNIFAIIKEKRWYESIIEYLISIGVIYQEKNIKEKLTRHKVSEEYRKYFINEDSAPFLKENYKKHLMLYKEGSKEFLEKTDLQKKDNKSKKDDKNLTPERRKLLQSIGTGFIIVSMVIFINFFTKFGTSDGIKILLNSVVFISGVLLNCKI